MHVCSQHFLSGMQKSGLTRFDCIQRYIVILSKFHEGGGGVLMGKVEKHEERSFSMVPIYFQNILKLLDERTNRYKQRKEIISNLTKGTSLIRIVEKHE